MKSLIAIAILALSCISHATEVILDSTGFVKAYYSLQKPNEAVTLSWDKSPRGYGRQIKATKVQSMKDLSRLSNAQIKSFWNSNIDIKGSVTVLDTALVEGQSDVILGEKIVDTAILSTLRQVEGGAKAKYNTDAVRYIEENKLTIKDYSRALNIKLTREFGTEFSSQVYRNLLLREPGTEESMKLFTSLLESDLQKNEVKFDGTTELWVAKGLMQNTEDVEKVKGMFEKVLTLMGEQGLPVHTFKTRTGDTVQVNADIVAKTLEERKANGKKVVILAVSKAVPEVLGGLANLNKKGFFDKPGNKDVVAGVILTAGPQDGMHFADFASMPVIFSVIKSKMVDMAAANKVDISNLKEGFKSLSHKRLGSYYESIIPHIPQVAYINLIGVSKAGNGYAEYKPLREMQEGLFNRWFFPAHGSNDGIVEYSSLVKTSTLGSKAVTLLAAGDHCIFPCQFNGREVNSNEDQMRSFASLFRFIEILNKKSSLLKKDSCTAQLF